ncbi:hypothetical protein BGZ52_001830 [Haplosporangium bisporale]|nr:hypothetical protein BGZ52_001830 [Haplosporangium bisporale]
MDEGEWEDEDKWTKNGSDLNGDEDRFDDVEEASQEFFEAFSTDEEFGAPDIYIRPWNKKRVSLVDDVEAMDETGPVDLRQAKYTQSQEPYKIAVTEAVLEPFQYNANSAINLSAFPLSDEPGALEAQAQIWAAQQEPGMEMYMATGHPTWISSWKFPGFYGFKPPSLTVYGESETMLYTLDVAMQALDGFSTINYISALGAFNEQRAQSGVESPLVSVSVGGWNLPTLKRVEIDVQDLSYL